MTKKRSMQKTYYLLSVFILLVTLLSFGTQLYIMRRMLFTNTQQLLQAAHQQSYANIEEYLNNIENVALSLGYNASVQRYLKETDSVGRLSLYPDIQTVFSGFFMSQPDVQGFAIYDKNGNFITANGTSYQAIIQSDSISPNSRITYSSFYTSNPYIGITVPYFVISVPVLDSNNLVISDNQIGTIVITMRQSYMKSQVATGNQLKGCTMILVDSSGHEIVGLEDSTQLNQDLYNNKSHAIFEDTFHNNDWRLITYFEKGVIADNMIPLMFTVIVTSILIIMLVITFVLLLSRQFISPINHISHFMSEVSQNAASQISEQNDLYHLPKKWEYSELLSMTDTMNSMLQSLDEKTEALLNKEKQYYEADLARHKTEIIAYRNQINPHFLYNTFECITGIAMCRNAPEVVEICQALSQMFRYAVKGENYVILEDEIIHMQQYALIIHYRFMGRITIHMDTKLDTKAYYVPSLVLQPIVENAVFHGLEKQIGSGRIEVNISEENGFLHIKVVDNGLGMDAQTVEQIMFNLENASVNSGIGLANIAHRIKLLYSDSGEIHISSIQETGTSVELILPVMKEANGCTVS